MYIAKVIVHKDYYSNGQKDLVCATDRTKKDFTIRIKELYGDTAEVVYFDEIEYI